MIVLMTGGTGLIGNALGQILVQQGHEVRLLVRDRDSARAKLSYPARIFDWNSETDLPSKAAVEGAEVLIHLAGENIAAKRWTSERKFKLKHSRVRTAQLLAQAFRAQNLELKVSISASAVGIYGDRGDEPLTESSKTGTDFLSELCRDWEAAAEEIPARRQVRARFGVVLSPVGGFLSQVLTPFRQFGASRLAHGQQYLSWIHIEDLAHIVATAVMDERFEGPINVCAPEPITNADMTHALADILKINEAPPVPALALKVLYGELASALLGSQRAKPEKLQALGWSFRHPLFRSAVESIYPGFEPGDVQLTFEHWIPADKDRVWKFFVDEKNLESITPPTLNLEVLKVTPERLESGTRIDYRLKIHGVPVKWQTQIEDWSPEKRFSDIQVKGPYKKWTHIHEFEPLGSGILMRDQVRFQLSLGAVGRIASLPFVLKDLNSIFSYRSMAVTEAFATH
jgi:uncharacterized protein (TIGR01777 family)